MSYKLTHNAIHTTTCSGLTKFALVALADFADENGECYPAQTTLAKLLGCSRRSVVYAITHLEKLGLLVRTGKHGLAVKYRLELPDCAQPLHTIGEGDCAQHVHTMDCAQPLRTMGEGDCAQPLRTMDCAQPLRTMGEGDCAQPLRTMETPTCATIAHIPAQPLRTNISLEYKAASKPAALNDILATLAEEYARGKSPAQAAVVRELKNLEAFPPKQRERIKRLAASDFEGVCDRLGYIRPIFGEAVAASLAAPADPLADIDKQLEAIKRGQNDDPLKDIDKQLEAIKRRREGGAL